MVGQPQKLRKGQEEAVSRILRNKLLTWTVIGFTILAGITGLSLWGIKERVETKMEKLVAKQFKEPRIQKVVRQVAADRASTLLAEQVNPEVAEFKAEIANQLKDLHALVARTQDLEAQSRQHEQSIQAVLQGLQHSLKQSQDAQTKLSSVRTDIVEMQKCLATIQYYQIKGANIFPNPYQKEMLDALNKLVAIAIPSPAERSKFITELQGPQEPKK